MSSNTPPKFQHPSFAGHIGLARADITPPIGVYSRNWGAAKHDVAESIHRPLTLTALILSTHSQDAPSLVLVDADLGWWKTPSTSAEFQRRVLEELSLDSAQFIFALSHTHAGPPLMQPDASLPGSELLQAWMARMVDTTVATVRKASQTMFAATLDWHTGQCALAAMRDLPEPPAASAEQSQRYLCGYNPQGEPDQTLVVGRITDQHGTLRGTLVNYACHPTTLAAENKAISPDYVGAMRETIESVTSAPALFLLGMCGDLAPRYQYVGDTKVADRHGRQLGFAALATLEDMEPAGTSLDYCGVLESGAPLAVWEHHRRQLSGELQAVRCVVPLSLKKDWPSAEELEQQRLACNDRAIEERLRRKRDIRRGIGNGTSYDLPLYVWRVGDAVLVGSCCEPYSWLQQKLRRRFPDCTLICMNLVNGSIGYLPPAPLYDCDVYPVWQTPFGRGSLELTLEAFTGVIHDVLSR